MTNNLTVDDIRRVVDQHKDHEVSITTDGIDVYVARMANRQAIEVAKVLLSEIDRLQRERDKLMTWAKNALVGAKHEACKYTEDDPDTTWHCCSWSEVVEEAERIGVTVE